MGKSRPYRMTTPMHQSGKRYQFQFHGSGALLLKHFVKVSSTIAAAAAFTLSLQSSSSCLQHNGNKACVRLASVSAGAELL
jgi:hypothetical protein